MHYDPVGRCRGDIVAGNGISIVDFDISLHSIDHTFRRGDCCVGLESPHKLASWKQAPAGRVSNGEW
jgi:hypothetical protein